MDFKQKCGNPTALIESSQSELEGLQKISFSEQAPMSFGR